MMFVWMGQDFVCGMQGEGEVNVVRAGVMEVGEYLQMWGIRMCNGGFLDGGQCCDYIA